MARFTLGFLAASLTLLASTASGQPLAGREDSGKRDEVTTAVAVVSSTTSALAQTQLPSSEQQQWSQDMARASERVRRSKWFFVGGAGLVGLGLLVQLAENESGYTYVTDTGLGTAKVLYLLAGGTVAYGVFERSRARNRLLELQAEGRQRGFTASISPTQVQFAFTVGF